jgi:hypothetical protein
MKATTLIIELRITGTREDAIAAVDRALDAGVLQDAIAADDDADCKVTSALLVLVADK